MCSFSNALLFAFSTVIHAYAKSGGTAAAAKAQQLLTNMHKMYEEGNTLAKPDTITVSLGVLLFERAETT